jgi:amidohydrolase
MSFREEAEGLSEYLVQTRRDFHRHPELGFQETRTAGVVAQTLTDLGLEVRPGVGQTGVVGALKGEQEGPVVLLRFDMDALPVAEENETDYISTNPGVMHACGHDGHMAIGLAVARIMARRRGQMAGTLKFLFQPGEEGRGGALAVLADGALENPRPDVALAMHLWNEIPYGLVRVNDPHRARQGWAWRRASPVSGPDPGHGSHRRCAAKYRQP